MTGARTRNFFNKTRNNYCLGFLRYVLYFPELIRSLYRVPHLQKCYYLWIHLCIKRKHNLNAWRLYRSHLHFLSSCCPHRNTNNAVSLTQVICDRAMALVIISLMVFHQLGPSMISVWCLHLLFNLINVDIEH